jgi:hypothetical protein
MVASLIRTIFAQQHPEASALRSRCVNLAGTEAAAGPRWPGSSAVRRILTQGAPSCPALSVCGRPGGMDYIRRGEGEDGGGCVFCDLPAADPSQDEANHLLARGKVSFVLLNAFPYNPGHLMAAPYRHVGDFVELTTEELAELLAETRPAPATYFSKQ